MVDSYVDRHCKYHQQNICKQLGQIHYIRSSVSIDKLTRTILTEKDKQH